MSGSHEILNFFGVYLLYCRNERFKGHTYIGFTVDPNRRVNQHNKGSSHGGAKRTSGRGPWDMVLIVHGFPNKISALRFEWAWQNPHKSRRLRNAVGLSKTKKELRYEYKLRVLCKMLSTGPWNRLPLTIRWLKQEYIRDFPPTSAPPLHMAIAYGPVKAVRKVSSTKEPGTEEDLPIITSKRCVLCYEKLDNVEQVLRCYFDNCTMASHMVCLAKNFLKKEPSQFIPIDGECPVGKHTLLWGNLIGFKHGILPTIEEESEDV